MILILLQSFLLLLTLSSGNIQHNYYWRDYKDIIPEDAINGTADLYIGQVYYEGILAGTFYPTAKQVVTECRGERRIIKYPIKILCDKRKDNFEWMYVNVKSLNAEKLSDMVVGGFEVNNTLYIGKIFHEGEWKIGRVFPPPYWLPGLTVWYNNGKQYITHDFQILRYLGKPEDRPPSHCECKELVFNE
ncbi:hypothetical protein MML48_3g00012080 [Holotrichia oblita]|uniref:Uncharacterized protein n=1 Tax=Holotrichia oblita TaxID=644536 RepID=A0ACB9TD59_HOLOL|nr:hypothetical protein MML48_3g00012080 [Holotrichia oblita]